MTIHRAREQRHMPGRLSSSLASLALAAAIAITACGSGESQAPPKPASSGETAQSAPPKSDAPASTPAPKKEVAASDDANPYAKYTEEPKVDEFNLDVKAGKVGSPHRGGKLRMRSPSDFQHFNVTNVTGQPERVALNMMSDSLVDMDYFSFETYPVIAWHWCEGDLVKLPGQDAQSGRVINRTDSEVTFVPDARIDTYNRFDVVDGEHLKSGDGSIKLKENWGGGTVTGRLTVFPHTVKVDTGYDEALKAKAVTYKIADLDTWVDDSDAAAKPEPFVKPHCVFEFFIRDGVKWHDGQPLTAADVKFTLDEVILNPDVDCAPARTGYEAIERVELFGGDKAVRITSKRPFFKALDAYGFGIGNRYVLPRHVFKPEQYSGDSKGFAEMYNSHPFKRQPILTGPYKIKEWKEGNSLTIVRNEDYWANKLPEGAIPFWKPEMPYMDEITWVVISDKQAAVKELEKQALDGDVDVEPDTWLQDLTNSESFKKIMTRAERSSFGYVYIGWNMLNPIFRDKDTRRALAMLIPRDEIARDLHDNLAAPVNGPMYFKSPAYDPTLPFIDYDPEGAKRLLRKNGWNDRDSDGILEKEIDGKMTPFKFRYMYHGARDYHQKMADVIKEKLGQGGIAVELSKLDWTIFSDTIRDKKFDSCRFAWTADMDPDLYPIWHSSQSRDKGDNFVSYKNPRVDELVLAMRREFDPVKRWEMGREVHRIINEDQPYCFLFNFQELYFLHRNLQGIKLYPSPYPHNFSEWYWAGDPPPGAKSDSAKQGG